jgi:hypothetical protein
VIDNDKVITKKRCWDAVNGRSVSCGIAGLEKVHFPAGFAGLMNEGA